MAPDAASAKAAKGLVVPTRWGGLGQDEDALWGECQGSGQTPYRVGIDLGGPAFKCSCPSRKFPCKHALALWLLRVQHGERFACGARPDWVAEWLAHRHRQAERRGDNQSGTETDGPATETAPGGRDPRAAARREATRLRRMQEGCAELELWLTDRVRQGLAQLPSEPGRWEAMAARMVDAQLPGLAYRLRRAGARVGVGADWPAAVLAELGRLALLIEGARRLDALPAGPRTDLQTALGWTIEREEVLAEGERVADTWFVAGVRVEEDGRLFQRRVWLVGRASGRTALLLDYAHGGARFAQPAVAGSTLVANLAFYPGAAPLRAVAVDAPLRAPEDARPGARPLAHTLAALAAAVAANPWQSPLGMLVSGTPLPAPGPAGGGWLLRVEDDAGDAALPLLVETADAWDLTAIAGGRPLDCFGEWDGGRLRPLAAWCESTLWTPTPEREDP